MSSESAARCHASLSDVSQAAHISIATASRAFVHPERVNADTLKRIYDAAEKVGYVPRKNAQQSNDDSGKLIAVVINDIGNPVYAEFVKSIQHRCREYGYSIMIIDSQEMSSIEHIMLMLTEEYVDGIVLTSSRLSDANIQKMAKAKPLVLINRSVHGVKSVIADTYGGLEKFLQELCSLGHKSLTYLSGPADSWQNAVRRETLSGICKKKGISLNVIPGSSPTYGGGVSCVAQFFQHPTSAVIAYNDIMAIGFMTAMKDCGIKVPEKVSVGGIDDIPISAIVSPALSTVRIDRTLIGKTATDELIGQLRGGNLRRSLKPIMIGSHFVMRGSVGAAGD